ncbi:hypothetical protein GDO86_000058 [Hymenochirus boettgeri]|uniref:Uncharacterized protein n=1 Tax=Hymenochirus boettgeri TaxID=247094 RepID=A0A8T2KD10_9PIPI|nr:hypothetical protein GDO86_000058 [Hymenochirus boettgeri]
MGGKAWSGKEYVLIMHIIFSFTLIQINRGYICLDKIKKKKKKKSSTRSFADDKHFISSREKKKAKKKKKKTCPTSITAKYML